jgi:hypothetical protein
MKLDAMLHSVFSSITLGVFQLSKDELYSMDNAWSRRVATVVY